MHELEKFFELHVLAWVETRKEKKNNRESNGKNRFTHRITKIDQKRVNHWIYQYRMNEINGKRTKWSAIVVFSSKFIVELWNCLQLEVNFSTYRTEPKPKPNQTKHRKAKKKEAYRADHQHNTQHDSIRCALEFVCCVWIWALLFFFYCDFYSCC